MAIAAFVLIGFFNILYGDDQLSATDKFGRPLSRPRHERLFPGLSWDDSAETYLPASSSII